MFRQVIFPLLLLVFLSSVLVAQPQERRKEIIKRIETHESLFDKLNLTEDQERQMKKIRLDFEKKQTQLRSSIHSARLDIQGLFLADKPDRPAIEKAMKGVSDLQYQLKVNHLDHWFAVNALLTPEQQKTWKSHHDRMGQHEGMGCCMKPGMQLRQHMMRGQLEEEEDEDD